MRIEWTQPLRTPAARRDERASIADRSFSSNVASDPSATVATRAASAMQSIEGLLSLQEVADEEGGRRRAVARGTRLLDALEDVRLALLAGTMPRERLAGLVRLAQESAPRVSDPRLAEILEEIELRAAVEIAKLDAL